MMKFALLASGSKGNCCLIRDEKSSIVIDCGSTKTYLRKCFERLQYDYKRSDALFITHTHSDHISQMKMFDSVATYSRCVIETNNFKQISTFEKIEVNSLKVKEIPLSHDSEIVSGFIIENEDKKLVYVTDTGYIKEEYLSLMKNADYYIFESNHDVEMLMKTRRPMYVKQRIIGDLGHLCNEDCADILANVVGDKTKEIVLAHISEEGNNREKAKEVLIETLKAKQIDHTSIRIVSAPQFEIIVGGDKESR